MVYIAAVAQNFRWLIYSSGALVYLGFRLDDAGNRYLINKGDPKHTSDATYALDGMACPGLRMLLTMLQALGLIPDVGQGPAQFLTGVLKNAGIVKGSRTVLKPSARCLRVTFTRSGHSIVGEHVTIVPIACPKHTLQCSRALDALTESNNIIVH